MEAVFRVFPFFRIVSGMGVSRPFCKVSSSALLMIVGLSGTPGGGGVVPLARVLLLSCVICVGEGSVCWPPVYGV